jgi:hypothetical protein
LSIPCGRLKFFSLSRFSNLFLLQKYRGLLLFLVCIPSGLILLASVEVSIGNFSVSDREVGSSFAVAHRLGVNLMYLVFLVFVMMIFVFELEVLVHSANWHSITKVPFATIVFMNNSFIFVEFSSPFSVLPLLPGVCNSSIVIISDGLVCSIELVGPLFRFFHIVLIISSDTGLNS